MFLTLHFLLICGLRVVLHATHSNVMALSQELDTELWPMETERMDRLDYMDAIVRSMAVVHQLCLLG